MTPQPEDSISTRGLDPENSQDTLARDPAGQDQELPGQDPFGPDRFGQDTLARDPAGQDVTGQDVTGPDPFGPGSAGHDPAAPPAAGQHAVDRIDPLREGAGPDVADQDEAGPDGAAVAAAEDQAARPPIAEPGAAAATAVPDSSGRLVEGNGVPATALAAQQWPGILALFVDDPRGAVERAAAAAREQAVALAAALDREQAALGASWQDDSSTEDLRTALQQYRSFCGRLEAWA